MAIPSDQRAALHAFRSAIAGLQKSYHARTGRYWQGDFNRPDVPEIVAGDEDELLVDEPAGFLQALSAPAFAVGLRCTRYQSPDGEGWFLEVEVVDPDDGKVYRRVLDGDGPRSEELGWVEKSGEMA